MNSTNKIMARRWLDLLIADSRAVEIRIDSEKGWVGGWFDDVGAIERVLSENSKKSLYTSLNRPKSCLVTNTVSGNYSRMKNDNVTAITRLFFDFDPQRPNNRPANSSELLMAKERAIGFRSEITALGWPQPAFGVSGNGVHVLYRCRFANDDGFQAPYKRLFKILAEKYSDDAVDMDSSVKSSSQLTRLYGSINYKGQAREDRPHRLATIWMPDDYQWVRKPEFSAVLAHYGADRVPERPKFRKITPTRPCGGSGDYTTLDIVSWLRSHGLYLRQIKDTLHGVTCPWESEHSCTSFNATIVYECTHGSQWPSFKCQHAHCADRTIRDVMERLGDPDQFCSEQFGGKRHG